GVTMASVLNPYLTFDGTAREAMTFYRSVFGGELKLNTFGELGAPDSPDADRIMHAHLTTDDGFTIMASDVPGEMPYEAPRGISVSLSGDDERLRSYWDALSEGGTVTMPFEKQVWGDEYGMCVDRFGVPWMV